MIFNSFPTVNQIWPGRPKGWRQKLMSEVNKGLMFPETRYPMTRRGTEREFTVHVNKSYTAVQLESIAPALALAGWEILRVKEFTTHKNLILRVIGLPETGSRPQLRIV